jgi:hypothetical protein
MFLVLLKNRYRYRYRYLYRYIQRADPTKVTIWVLIVRHKRKTVIEPKGTMHGLQKRRQLNAKEDHKL